MESVFWSTKASFLPSGEGRAHVLPIVFRKGVDPVQLYISIAALGYFYLSNKHTLSTIFGRDLGVPAALTERGSHIADVVLGFLRP